MQVTLRQRDDAHPIATAAVPARAATLQRRTRRVLILDQDLYATLGGGQTAYRRLIELCSDTVFYYFTRHEPANRQRPENARPIPLREHYYANVGDLPAELHHFYGDYLNAAQMAASVAAALGRRDFDAVDGPDYRTETLFIRGALAQHGIRVGTVALAMHGLLSSVFRQDWSGTKPCPRMMAELRVRERLQYRAADTRYAMSAFYADLWTRWSGGLSPTMIDPLCMAGAFDPQPAPNGGPPDLAYIGRRERCKGPDLFVDLAWTLPRDSIGRLLMIGPDATGFSNVSSQDVIEAACRRRQITVETRPQVGAQALDELFRARTIALLPARYETFNLVVLEALLRGCPAYVGEGAGVARWIRTTLPELDHLVLNVDCGRSASAALRHAITHYDDVRDHLVDTLRRRALRADSGSLRSIYAAGTPADTDAQRALSLIATRLDSFNRPRTFSNLPRRHRAKRFLATIAPAPLHEAAMTLRRVRLRLRLLASKLRRPRRTLQQIAKLALVRQQALTPRSVTQVRFARDIEGSRHRLLTLPERNQIDITAKLTALSGEVGGNLIGRVPIMADLARLEIKRGRPLIAATYYLRIMRWLDGDTLGRLPFVTETLRTHGFAAEAETAAAMFGPEGSRAQPIRALLDEQYNANRTKKPGALAHLDDRRGERRPRAAVIVSLYDASEKLPTLLANLKAQTLIADSQLEIVLVDSGSPSDERSVFETFARANPSIPMVYGRSAARETIQAAWNRGMLLARAPYVTCLGADEGLHPEALAVLAAALDANPSVDWVMADSIVTEVDRRGIYTGDIMSYDRRDYSHDMVYLDTTYLNWVAGLYRRSIHTHFGYYDERFRAAGDTEFKLRIARHIRSMHVPRPLGVFNNYPEARTTQHPRAEIEDLRAWYLHRTPSGMAYAFDGRPLDDARALFQRCLSYRKSYTGHFSTDFDLAHAVAGHWLAASNGRDPIATHARAATAQMLARLRAIETMDLRRAPLTRQRDVLRGLRTAAAQAPADWATFGLKAQPTYDIFNDNRFEQHAWSWST